MADNCVEISEADPAHVISTNQWYLTGTCSARTKIKLPIFIFYQDLYLVVEG
jgi:hypothetical protein